MTLGIYNIIWWVLRPILPLVLGLRQQKGKEQAGRRQDRYGQPHFDSRLSGVIWLHSVSVGETIAAISLASVGANATRSPIPYHHKYTLARRNWSTGKPPPAYLYSTPSAAGSSPICGPLSG